MLDFIIGALFGALFIYLLRRWKLEAGFRIYAVALIVAALIYQGFALNAADARWLGYEAAGVLAYGALALLGLRYSPWLIAAGWALHVLWDVLLHSAEATPFVPAWYPGICIGFDLAVAVYLAYRLRR